MNAAARLVYSARKYDLHWLRASEQIAYRLAVLAFRCQQGLAPSYLSTELQRVTDLDSRRLRSAYTTALVMVMPRMRHSTISDCAFPTAAAACMCVEQSTAGCYAVAIITDLQE